MSAAEFLIELLDKLAWPSLILVLVLIFKGSLRELLKRLESIGTKYGTLNFQESLDQAKEEADKAKLPEFSEGLAKDEMGYYETSFSKPTGVLWPRFQFWMFLLSSRLFMIFVHHWQW